MTNTVYTCFRFRISILKDRKCAVGLPLSASFKTAKNNYKSGKCLPNTYCTYALMCICETVETEQQRVQFKHTVMQLIMGQCTYVSRVIMRWIKAICMAVLQAIWSSV